MVNLSLQVDCYVTHSRPPPPSHVVDLAWPAPVLILLHLRKVQCGQKSAALNKDTHISMASITSQPPEGMGQTSWEKSDSLLHCYKVPPVFLPALTPTDPCTLGLVSPLPAQSISTTHWASKSLFPPACCLLDLQFSVAYVLLTSYVPGIVLSGLHG